MWLARWSIIFRVNQFIYLWLEAFISKGENVTYENYKITRIVQKDNSYPWRGWTKLKLPGKLWLPSRQQGSTNHPLGPNVSKCLDVYIFRQLRSIATIHIQTYWNQSEFSSPESLLLCLPYETGDQWENGKQLLHLNKNLFTRFIHQEAQAIPCP